MVQAIATPFRITREALEQASWFRRDEYPFASHYLSVGAGALHYLDEGDGSPVLVVHGTPSWSFEFRGVVARLRGHRRCVVPDHLGFGLSDRPAGRGLGVAEHAGHLARLVDHLDLRDVHLVVHDFGGPIGLPLLDSHRVRIARVTILNSWFWPFEDADPGFARQNKWLDSGLMRLLYLRANFSARTMVKLAWGRRTPLDASRHAHYRKMFPTAESRRSTWALAQAMVHGRDHYAAHAAVLDQLRTLPVQLVWGSADRFVNHHQLARWRTLVPAARVVELADVGHFVGDEAAGEVAAAIDEHAGR